MAVKDGHQPDELLVLSAKKEEFFPGMEEGWWRCKTGPVALGTVPQVRAFLSQIAKAPVLCSSSQAGIPHCERGANPLLPSALLLKEPLSLQPGKKSTVLSARPCRVHSSRGEVCAADPGMTDERGTAGFLALGTASFALLRVLVETPLGHWERWT